MCEKTTRTDNLFCCSCPDDVARLAFSIDRHRETKWVFEPVRNPLNIDPNSEIEAWLDHLFDRLHNRMSVSARARESHGLGFEKRELKHITVVTLKESALKSELTLVHYGNDLYAFVSGKETPEHDQFLPWVASINYATEKLSEEHPLYDWWAVVGSESTGNQMKCIGESIELGSLKAREFNWACREMQQGDFQSWGHCLWLPVLVEGQSKGYSSEYAVQEAHKELHRLCVVLSIETDLRWILRQEAKCDGLKSTTRPERHRGAIEPCTQGEEEELLKHKFNIDMKRLREAWAKCSTQQYLQDPTVAYYQGLGLMKDYPSFALLAFVSSIEAIGKILFEQETPENCQACGKTKFNPSRRVFQKALELVESVDKAQRMTDRLYGWRSGTAHQGRTFGHEDTFGRWLCSNLPASFSPQEKFSLSGLHPAKNAARSLLLKIFSGELPNIPDRTRQT